VQKLANVEVQLKWLPATYRPIRQVSGEGNSYFPLRVHLNSNNGLVQTPDGQAVAVLDMDSFRVLSMCGKIAGFRIDVWVLETEWKDKTAELQKLKTSRRKTVCINVNMVLFGQGAFGDQVATALGSFQQFLQPPGTGMFNCSYENPQSLQVPDTSPSMQNVGRPLPATLMIEELDEMTDNIDKPRDGETAQLQDLISGIEDWFDKLPPHRSIAMASRDSRILTRLFR